MKSKKDAKYLNVNINRSVYDRLEIFSRHTGISKTAAVEQGLELFMADFCGRNPNRKMQEELEGVTHE